MHVIRGPNPKEGPQKRENTQILRLNWVPKDGPINPKDKKKKMTGNESKWAH